jgi:hypothetical protein
MSAPVKPQASPLDALAQQAQAFETTPEHGTEGTTTGQQSEQEAQAEAMLKAGMVTVLMMVAKVGRAMIARHLPEIKDEWPDAMLHDTATAAVPLLEKHLAKLMEVVGSSPELAAFVMSLFPMGLGLMAAMEKADQNARARAKEAQALGEGANDA